MQPGDVVHFHIPLTGVFVRKSGEYAVIRTKRSEMLIPMGSIVEVIDPDPPEELVVAEVHCPGCHRKEGVVCVHKQTGGTIKHPHRERIELFKEMHA